MDTLENTKPAPLAGFCGVLNPGNAIKAFIPGEVHTDFIPVHTVDSDSDSCDGHSQPRQSLGV